MPTPSSIYFYVNWAKERLDEMEAVLTSLEGKAGEMQADARDKAGKAIAGLAQEHVIVFREAIKKQAEAERDCVDQRKGRTGT